MKRPRAAILAVLLTVPLLIAASAPYDRGFAGSGFTGGPMSTFTQTEKAALANVVSQAKAVITLSTHPEKRAALIADLGSLVRNGQAALRVLQAPSASTPTPAPTPTPAEPPISLVPTIVPAVVGYARAIAPTPLTLAGLDALRFGSSGPVFVVVHGGPMPAGNPGQLSDVALHIVAHGGQAFLIDYHADSWQAAEADVRTAIEQVRALVGAPVTVVAHSYGGYPASIAVLRDGAGDAYVAVNAVCSKAGVSYQDGPDPIALAANRPAVPVTVIRSTGDPILASDNREGFIEALHAAGHPGLNLVGPGDHTGPLVTDATLDAMFATAAMSR